MIAGVVISGLIWIGMMWQIMGYRPGTHFADILLHGFAASLIFVLAWVKAHGEIARGGHWFRLVFYAAGAMVLLMITLPFTWGFGLDSGDNGSLLSFDQAYLFESYLYLLWTVTLGLYIVGVVQKQIKPVVK